MKKLFIISILVAIVGIATAQNDFPSARTGHTLTIVNDDLYMFGGEEISKNKSTKSIMLNDLHKFQPSQNNWQAQPHSTPEPSGRKGHAAIGYNGQMIISCGQTSDGYDNGIWKYDVNTQSWNHITVTGATIEPRMNHAIGAYGNYIYILGGQNQNGDVTSCYKINIYTWEATSIGGIPSQGGKTGAALFIENGYIVLSGGLTNGQPTGNVSIYDLNGGAWSAVTGNHVVAFPGSYSNCIIGGNSQVGKSTKGLLSTMYSCTFTPPSTFTMTEVSNNIPQGEYFNSFVKHFSFTPTRELDSTFYFWGGTNNQTFYSYIVPTDGGDDTLSIYDPTGQGWIVTEIQNQELKVEPGTCIKVESGTTLNMSGGSDLQLESDATADATVIAFGSVTLGNDSKAIVQRYLPGEVSAWHMVSAPVSAMTIANSDWSPNNDEDLYLWHEPDPGTWVNYKNTSVTPTFTAVNPGDNFIAGRGYIVNYNSANLTNKFESSGLNTGDINITLAKSTTKAWDWEAGWNLIGNPYASGLDWNAVSKTGIVTEIYAQIYNASKAGGAGYEAVDGVIGSGQGFFVQAASDQVVLSLHPSQQVHSTTQTFKKSGSDKLVLRLSNDVNYDETTILINGESIPEHDFYDASKLFSFDPMVPQFYTLTPEGRKLAINSMNAITESTAIPLSLKMQGSGIMSISITKAEGIFGDYEIILQDLITNVQQELSEHPTYNFMASEDDDQNRFLLKFGSVGVDEFTDNGERSIWMQYGSLYVLNPYACVATVELYSIQGQVILRREIGQGLQSIPVNVATGTYLVMMRTDNAVTTRKLIINQ